MWLVQSGCLMGFCTPSLVSSYQRAGGHCLIVRVLIAKLSLQVIKVQVLNQQPKPIIPLRRLLSSNTICQMTFCLISLSKHSLPGYPCSLGHRGCWEWGDLHLLALQWELERPDCIRTRNWPPIGLKCSVLMFPFSCPPTLSSLLLFHVANSCPAPCKFHSAHHRHSDTCSMYIELIQIKYQNIGNYLPATSPSIHTSLSCY